MAGGLLADEELSGDTHVRDPPRDQREDLELARRETGRDVRAKPAQDRGGRIHTANGTQLPEGSERRPRLLARESWQHGGERPSQLEPGLRHLVRHFEHTEGLQRSAGVHARLAVPHLRINDDAKELFGGWREPKPYIRIVSPTELERTPGDRDLYDKELKAERWRRACVHRGVGTVRRLGEHHARCR